MYIIRKQDKVYRKGFITKSKIKILIKKLKD